MKYAVKCKKSIDRMSDEQLLKELLYLRGVEDVETLLKIDEGKGRMLFDSYRFNNMNDGLDLFYKHLNDGSPIHLLMDVDCFVGETKIKMLDGTIKTFNELYEQQDNDTWVYSCDEHGNLKPGKVLSVVIKGEATEMCKVTFDNDKYVICTPDHRFMLRDGSYKQAKDLRNNDSIMPLYYERRIYGNCFGEENMDYEYISTSKGKQPTHIIMSQDLGQLPEGYHRHHKNFNRFDNRPSNIEYLTINEHMKKHGEKNAFATYNGSEKHKEDIKRAWKNGKYEANIEKIKQYNRSEKNRETTRELNQRDDVKILQQRGKMAKIGKTILELGYELTEDNIINKPWIKDDRWKYRPEHIDKNGVKYPSQAYPSPTIESINKYFDSFDEFVECSKNYNHKVKNVEFITYDNPVKLYDMEVEEYHNFAVDLGDNSGIFVHNCDGLTSSAVMYLWIKKHYPNVKITFDCNEGKKHGITRDIINRIPEDVQLLITPDSSSSDVEQHIELWESGIDILVLDHHEFDKEAKTPAVIINCMDGNYPNTSLTGVGVVYKFLQQYEFDMGWDCKYLNELLPLVALGQLADLADVRELETRTLCRQGMQDFDKNNLLLNEIVREQEYSMKGQCNFTSIGWYVAPLMNAIFREGTLEDRYDLFKAICNFEEQRIYEPKRKTKDNPNKEPVVETLQKNIIRRAKSIKSHQDNEVKKEYKQIQELVDDTNKILIIDVTDKILPGHSGLIANKLAHQYMRPVILLNGDGGSGRGYDKFPIDDFNNWLTESGLIKCSGHANAFGIDFNRNDIELLQNWCNEQLDGVDIEPTWHVDFMFDIAKLKSQHILRVGKFEQFWGGKCMEEPLFAITGIQIETGDVQRLGQSQTMMKFTTNINGQEIDFVRPFTGEEMYKQFVCENNSTRGIGRNSVGNKKIDVTVIGKFKVNNFAGKDFPQIEIVAFETSVATGRNRRRNF